MAENSDIVPKSINDTDEFKEIHNHIGIVNQILLTLGKKAEKPQQKVAVASARRELNSFVKEALHEVERALE